MSTQISIRFDEEIRKRLEKVSSDSGRSVSQIIRQCTVDHLEDLEDIYDSLRRLEKGEASYSLSAIKQQMLNNK